MSRSIRFIRPDSLVEVTCRTLQGRLLLRPSAMLSEIILGVLGRAQRMYQMEIHAFVFLSNHYHLLVTAQSASQLARFMGYVNSNLAREAGRLHGWQQKFWGRRYQAIVVSGEERAQIARLEYLLAHGAKEGLVRSPKEWPGAHCVHALLDSSQPVAGTWFDRSAEYRAQLNGVKFEPRDFASLETVRLSPLPTWRHAPEAVQTQRIAQIVEQIETASEANRRQTGTQPLGRTTILRQRPHERPTRSKRSPAPLIHAATKRVRLAWWRAYRFFVAAYRRASDAFRQGASNVTFPSHCFPPPPAFVGELLPVPQLAAVLSH